MDLYRSLKSPISKIFSIWILNLSFKIILIWKPQIYVFVKYLNFFIFEKVFGLNLNFEFKFNLKKRNSKAISIFWPGQTAFGPSHVGSPAG
jgi:hypothetical protein